MDQNPGTETLGKLRKKLQGNRNQFAERKLRIPTEESVIPPAKFLREAEIPGNEKTNALHKLASVYPRILFHVIRRVQYR